MSLRSGIPYRVFMRNFTYEHSVFYLDTVLCRSQAGCLLFFCRFRLGQILHGNAFAGFLAVIVLSCQTRQLRIGGLLFRNDDSDDRQRLTVSSNGCVLNNNRTEFGCHRSLLPRAYELFPPRLSTVYIDTEKQNFII